MKSERETLDEELINTLAKKQIKGTLTQGAIRLLKKKREQNAREAGRLVRQQKGSLQDQADAANKAYDRGPWVSAVLRRVGILNKDTEETTGS